MKVFITGARGYVGEALQEKGALPLDCDVTKPESVETAIRRRVSKNDVVLHLAGKSDVDFCENKENHHRAFNVNVMGTSNVFSVLEENGIRGVYMSSNQIWGGGLFEGKHKESSSITPAKNQYGMLKTAAEFMSLDYGAKVIRTSYLFDSKRLSDKLAKLANGVFIEEPIFMVRSFMHLYHFAESVMKYMVRFPEMPEILHVAGSQSVSWYEFMRRMAMALGYNYKLVKPKLLDDPRMTPRPWNGSLDTSLSKKYGLPQYSYIDGINLIRDDNS